MPHRQPEACAQEEPNEVLQFLLGKTNSIKSDDTSSVASTSSSLSPSLAESDEAHRYGAIEDHVAKDRKGWMLQDMPELDPVSEDENVSSLIKESDDIPTRKANQAPPMKSSSHTMAGTDRSQSQPEDEDAGPRNTSKQLKKTKKNSVPTMYGKSPRKTNSSGIPKSSRVATPTELFVVAAVLFGLVWYCLAIMYRFFYPIHLALPDHDGLFTPWDLSNVSLQITSPRDGSEALGSISLEWEINFFPAEAIRTYGPEPFQYRLFHNDRRLLSEMDFWLLEDIEGKSVDYLNKTLRHRLAQSKLEEPGTHEFRVEVTFPVPGSIDEIRTLKDTITVIKRPPISSVPTLEVASPLDGATFPSNGNVLVEYHVKNVHRLLLKLDRKYTVEKHHINDGNIFLRKLGAGEHTIELQAFDTNNALALTRTLHFHVASSG